MIDDFLIGGKVGDVGGDAGRFENGLAHVDGGGLEEARFVGGVVDIEDAGAGLDAHGVGGCELVIGGVFGDAPDSVAAHFGFRAVVVEHAHLDVGGCGIVGWEDKDEAVAADACVAVGDLDGEAHGIADGFFESVDVDVVVAEAVHFGELHSGGIIADWMV